ncbi:MAG: RAD55 family ATPase [Candidatus Heimdallarchaeota archaeon]
MIDRIKTGIDGLDSLVNGGIPRGSVISIKGQPGSGKSIFSRQFLAHGCQKFNEISLLVILEEDISELIESSLMFGWDFEQLAERQKCYLVDLTPKRNASDNLSHKFLFPKGYAFIPHNEYTPANFNAIISKLIKDLMPVRMIIDSITPILMMHTDVFHARGWMAELVTILKQKNTTTLLVSERTYPPAFDMIDLSIADGIITLNTHAVGNWKKRYLTVEKMRKTKHTMSPIVFRITEGGINIFPDEPVFTNSETV